MDQGKFKPRLEAFKLVKDVVQPVFDLFKKDAEVQGLTFKLVTAIADTAVYVDKARAQQILINLLSNAIKFSKHQDTIEVFIGVPEHLIE